MTQCVVLGFFLCVEMCLVWSWFGLFLIYYYSFLSWYLFLKLARWCYCYMFRWSACLFIWASFLRLLCSVASTWVHKCSKHTRPSLLSPPPRLFLPRSHCPPHTPTHSATPETSPQTPSPPTTPSLCSTASVPPHLLTDFLVFLQSRKASEQAKSVDSKTDSIGSGRAIPIKQVSSFITVPLCLISCYVGE